MALLPDEATAADIPVVIPDAGPWITFLERQRQRLIPSARAIERQAILAGSQFSRLRYPPDE